MKRKAKARPRGSLTDAIIRLTSQYSPADTFPPTAADVAIRLGVIPAEITGILARLAKTGRIGRTERYGSWVYFKAQPKTTAPAAEPSAPAFV